MGYVIAILLNIGAIALLIRLARSRNAEARYALRPLALFLFLFCPPPIFMGLFAAIFDPEPHGWVNRYQLLAGFALPALAPIVVFVLTRTVSSRREEASHAEPMQPEAPATAQIPDE